MFIDIKSFLEKEEIPYSSSGENVTQGWINLRCIFCNDHANHLGINLESGVFHCWICGEKGDFNKFVRELLICSWQTAKKTIETYTIDAYIEQKNKFLSPVSNNNLKKINFDKFMKNLPDLHKKYLLERNFDPNHICEKYLVRSCYVIGRFPYRLVIPIIMENKIVNLTSRDVTNKQTPKYKNLSNEEAIIPMKECIYNIDSIKDKVVIVEGVTKVWRIGDGAVATMGIEVTQKQIDFLIQKCLRQNFKEAYIMFDNDSEDGQGECLSQRKAEKLANSISSFISKVEVILPKGDPADMTFQEVVDFRKEINL